MNSCVTLLLFVTAFMLGVTICAGQNISKEGTEQSQVAENDNDLDIPIAYLFEFQRGTEGNNTRVLYHHIDTYNGLKNICGENKLGNDKYFNMFDTNKNGLISEAEFAYMYTLQCNLQGLFPYDIERKLSKDQMPMFRAADENSDGFLSQNEFKALLLPFCYNHMHDGIINQQLRLDSDNNQAVSLREFLELTDIMLPSIIRHQIEDAYHTYDANESGELEGNEIFEWQLACYMNDNFPSQMLKKVLRRSLIDDFDDDIYNFEGPEIHPEL